MVPKKYNANEGKTEVMVSTWKMKKRWRNTNKFKNDERERERGGGGRQTDKERLGGGGGVSPTPIIQSLLGAPPHPPTPNPIFGPQC